MIEPLLSNWRRRSSSPGKSLSSSADRPTRLIPRPRRPPPLDVSGRSSRPADGRDEDAASRQTAARSAVREWQTVTVQFSAGGARPWDAHDGAAAHDSRPAFRTAEKPLRFRSSMTPGAWLARSRLVQPEPATLTEWKPSTSLSGETCSRTRRSWMEAGGGAAPGCHRPTSSPFRSSTIPISCPH